jgi:hypothetical protein
VEHAKPLEAFRELADFSNQGPPGQMCVVGKALVTDRNRL